MKKILLAVLFLSTSPLLAQPKIVHQNLYWVRYYNILNFNPKWSLHTEIDTRHFLPSSNQHQFISHLHLMYKPSKAWFVGGGFSYSLVRPQLPETRPRPGTPELRAWQQIGYNWPLAERWSLSGRIRTEERFLSNHTGRFDSDHHFVFRHRYRVQLTYTLKDQGLTFRLFDEVFLNTFHQNFFDQNRVYISAEKRFTRSISAELGYMDLRQLSRNAQRLYQRNILRLTLTHTLRPM